VLISWGQAGANWDLETKDKKSNIQHLIVVCERRACGVWCHVIKTSVLFVFELCFILVQVIVSRVRFPAGVGNFYLHHRVQNGSGARPASYPMRTRGSLPGGKADLSPRSSAEVKVRGAVPTLSQYAFMVWCSVKKSTGTLTLPLPLLFLGPYRISQKLLLISVPLKIPPEFQLISLRCITRNNRRNMP
jgi:hypothetical protein